MKTVITIDTGTTNTRVVLWQDYEPVSISKRPIGVRNTAISGNKKELQGAVRESIREVLSKQDGINKDDLVVIASGMITSNLGLVEIPHLKAPVGLSDLAEGMRQVLIPEVFDQPIWFIPGVKNDDQELTPESIVDMDVMRGEEVEAIGAMESLQISKPSLIILPGSHTKIIKTNAQKQIVGSITSMTGEILDLLTKKSVLADSVNEHFIDKIDRNCLILGAQTAEKNGLGRTTFTVRLLGMYTDYNRNQRANYLLGAVLANDLVALKKTCAFNVEADTPVIIIGKPGLRDALKILIEADTDLSEKVYTEEIQDLAGRGAIQIAKGRKIFELSGGKSHEN